MLGEKKNIVLTSRGNICDDFLDIVFSEDTKKVQCLSLTNGSILNYDKSYKLKEALSNGTIFEFIGANPEKENIEKELRYKTSDNKIGIKSLEDPLIFCSAYLMDCKNEFIYYFTDVDINYSMIIVNKKNGDIFIHVDLYTYGIEDKERRSFIINNDDYKNIVFYTDQFIEFRKNSTRIEFKIPKSQKEVNINQYFSRIPENDS